MHSTKQLALFLIIACVLLVCAEVVTRRHPATPRYVLLGGVWVTLVAMLLWSYGSR